MIPHPIVMRGAEAIGQHLGVTPGQAQHLHQQRHLPTFHLPGDSAPCATAGGLDEWRQLATAEALLGR
jgi:hypothetical protein